MRLKRELPCAAVCYAPCAPLLAEVKYVLTDAYPGSRSPALVPHAELAQEEFVQILHLMGRLGSVRNDPRAWRLELLAGLLRILPGRGAAVFVLRNVGPGTIPEVVTHFDAGFQSEIQRQAFLREIHAAPMQDPLGQLAIRRFVAEGLKTLTLVRSDAVDEEKWNNNLHVLTYRRASGTDDCVISLHRSAGSEGTVYAIYAMGAPASRRTEGSVQSDMRRTSRFGMRERTLVDMLHRGVDWLYTSEEGAHRLNQASALSPRVRETLEHLLRGETERQVARKMSLSVHTVHDYVKVLYSHYGVCSRRELMARWIQVDGKVRPKESLQVDAMRP